MKIKVIARAWYKNTYLKEGQIIDFKGDKLPSWATLADGIETQKGNKPNNEQKTPQGEQTNPETPNSNEGGEGEEKTPEGNENPTGEGDETNPDTTEQKELVGLEAQEYLERLINEGIEKDILVEDAEKKTVQEQIKELEEKLGKGKNPCV